jgi:molybdenum-dependent DNA-binding transcriptional regulator ModE
MEFQPNLNLIIDGHYFSYKLYESLKCISKTWSQREAAKHLKISHSVLNRRIKDAEKILGYKLVEVTNRGSEITVQGKEILEEFLKYSERIKDFDSPIFCGGHISSDLLGSLSRDFGFEPIIYSCDDNAALEMADRRMVNILTLDDPVHAFMWDLKFIPLAYDHLVLISSKDCEIDDVKDLNGKKFVEVPYSAQRLAWNTLDELKIDYSIIDVCKSPYVARKMVENSEDLYTFLNHSMVGGGDILADETKHILSMVVLENQDHELDDFLDYVQGRGQIKVEKYGFQKID